jgi:hypothetical protein
VTRTTVPQATVPQATAPKVVVLQLHFYLVAERPLLHRSSGC